MFKSLIAARTFGLTLKGMSETETGRGYAWSAKIYLDGKNVGFVENRGDGGCNFVHTAPGIEQMLVDGAKAAGYVQTEADGETPAVMISNRDFLEHYLDKLFSSLSELKRLKRKSKTKTLFTKKGAPQENIYVIDRVYTPSVKAHLLERQDVGFILNDLIE